MILRHDIFLSPWICKFRGTNKDICTHVHNHLLILIITWNELRENSRLITSASKQDLKRKEGACNVFSKWMKRVHGTVSYELVKRSRRRCSRVCVCESRQYHEIRSEWPVTPTKRRSGVVPLSTSTLQRVFQVAGEQPADPVSELSDSCSSEFLARGNKNVSAGLIGLNRPEIKKISKNFRSPAANLPFSNFSSNCNLRARFVSIYRGSRNASILLRAVKSCEVKLSSFGTEKLHEPLWQFYNGKID